MVVADAIVAPTPIQFQDMSGRARHHYRSTVVHLKFSRDSNIARLRDKRESNTAGLPSGLLLRVASFQPSETKV
jgi:hypothetical protein